jgi:class 3 adenylate cyclase
MAQSEVPHTRGFLFADLRGYTQFVETHGDDAASQLLSAYRTVVRAAVAQSNGAEIRTEGDGFYVVFPSASSAIRCAMAILEEAAQSTAAAGGPLQVGIGIHAGETAESGEGFVGSAVNIAARVCAVAGAGELLVTETVRGLVRTSMRLGVEPRGRRHLKGIKEPIPLFAIRASGEPTRSRPFAFFAARGVTRPVLVALATLAGVAALAMLVLTVGLLTGTKANPSGGSPGAAAGSSASPTASPSDDTFPNAAEQALLNRIDPSMPSFCLRAAKSQYPLIPSVEVAGTPVERLPVLAGLRCSLGGSAPDVVSLWAVAPTYRVTGAGNLAFTTATVSTYFFRRVSDAKAPPGDCATDDLAYMSWSFGLRTGKLLCVSTPARARFDWTFDDEDLIATAERDDGDGAALYRWWLDLGRVLLH